MAAGDLRWPETGPRTGATRRGRAATKDKAIRKANGTLVNAGAIRRRNEAKILEAAEAVFAQATHMYRPKKR